MTACRTHSAWADNVENVPLQRYGMDFLGSTLISAFCFIVAGFTLSETARCGYLEDMRGVKTQETVAISVARPVIFTENYFYNELYGRPEYRAT